MTSKNYIPQEYYEKEVDEMDEKELMLNYVTARSKVEELDSQLKEAKEVLNSAETSLIEYMENEGITATAKYEQLGKLTLVSPMLRVNITPGCDTDAFEYLKEIGEESAIKQSIHWKTLASVMKPKVEANEPLPECFSYYFQKQTRFEKP